MTFRGGRWWHRALQLPRSMTLFPEDDPYPVEAGYTPVFVNGTARRRHLLHEAYPQPCTGQQVATDLGALLPDEQWSAKRVKHLVSGVRRRLSRAGVPGLTREEVGEPVGNMLNHNLVTELLQTRTLVPPDVLLLDDV